MDDGLIKFLAVAFAVGFCGIVALLIRRCMPGWASDAAFGRGAGLSLLSMGLALVFSGISTGLGIVAFGGKAPVIWDAFVNAALCEETARYIALLVLLRGLISDDAREFVAGAAAIGLGFGVMENLFYLSGNKGGEMGHVELGLIRGIVSAPGHLASAFLSGYGIWAVARRKAPVTVALATFALAVLLHGAFDAAVMAWPSPKVADFNGHGLPALVGLGVLIVLTIVADAAVTLYMLGEFIGWSRRDATHDKRSGGPLEVRWVLTGRVLALLALGMLVAPLAVMGWSGSAQGVFYAPILTGAAGSLALWSLAIGHLAE